MTTYTRHVAQQQENLTSSIVLFCAVPNIYRSNASEGAEKETVRRNYYVKRRWRRASGEEAGEGEGDEEEDSEYEQVGGSSDEVCTAMCSA